MGGPYLTKRQIVAIRIEATEGTAETLSAGNVVATTYDADWKPTFNMADRDVQQSSFTRIRQVCGDRSAVISFATELKGSGTAGVRPTNLDVALRACGMACTSAAGVSITYKPGTIQSGASATVAIYEYDQGSVAKKKMITGARGTVVIDAVKGDVVLCRFTFTGKFNIPTDGSGLTASSIVVMPTAFLAAQFSFLGASLKIQNASIDLGQKVTMRTDANQSGGNYSAIITGRNVTGSCDPESDATSVIDLPLKLLTNVEGVFKYVLSGGTGNVVTVSANKCQITNLSPADRDGLRTSNLDLAFNQFATTGNDEFAIKFT